MSDWDFEEVMTGELSGRLPDRDFRRRLKQQSMQSLKTRHYAGLWFRRIGVGCALLMLVIVSFLGGRFSVRQPDRVSSHDPRDNTIQMSRDLIPWLRAGLLFTQLGLDDRANNAFRKANELASEYRNQDYVVVDMEQNDTSPTLKNPNDQGNNQIRSELAKELRLALSLQKETGRPLLAQYMGAKNHD
jgi:hypothetical protein